MLTAPYRWRCSRQLHRRITDPALRDALTPRDRLGCKRILISNDCYPALARDNVGVVTAPIDRATADGLVTTAGHLHELDVLVMGTGFAATQFMAPMAVIGPGGTGLSDVWRDGAKAYLGMTVAGFPNFFMLYGPNTNLGHTSMLIMLEAQIAYVVQAAELLAAAPGRVLDVRRAARPRPRCRASPR
ncbi:hypothetical protein ND748_02760 [Frankia sp. AiPs1]|uniref:hypothetical protein n=1 Tax=Frankia sp. AiPs1 TaxID=573493 RepID=UPI0020433CBF|nr:hypothetical protein [Frankia sp. AiPs1]MCM3920603.1 hypothetical protein [Frankia sp. AiPs1]